MVIRAWIESFHVAEIFNLFNLLNLPLSQIQLTIFTHMRFIFRLRLHSSQIPKSSSRDTTYVMLNYESVCVK